MLVRWARKHVYTMEKPLISTELHAKVVISLNRNVYIIGTMILNITHVRGKGGLYG